MLHRVFGMLRCSEHRRKNHMLQACAASFSVWCGGCCCHTCFGQKYCHKITQICERNHTERETETPHSRRSYEASVHNDKRKCVAASRKANNSVTRLYTVCVKYARVLCEIRNITDREDGRRLCCCILGQASSLNRFIMAEQKRSLHRSLGRISFWNKNKKKRDQQTLRRDKNI